MFGYIKIDNPYLYKKDEVLYNSMYCSVCKSIGKCCGQACRMSLTYDITFFSIIAHNILGVDVEIKKKNCITHWFKKRPIAKIDDISLLMADINVILAYHKILDDILDINKGKIKKFILKKGYKKAIKRNPEVKKIVEEEYENLRKLEKEKCQSLDMICDSFAKMMERLSIFVLGEKSTDYTKKLFYNLGKWIYLIDALDDIEKDRKNNNYNPFNLNYKDKTVKEIIEQDPSISFLINGIFSSITECLNNIEFQFNTDLLKNILLRGLPVKTAEIISKGNKSE